MSQLDMDSYRMTPTRSGLETTPTVYMASCRTTLVDVMTTLNTASHAKGAKPEIFKGKTSDTATLPQRMEQLSLKSEQSPGRGGKTRFEQLKSLDAHYSRCQGLLNERDDYFLALYAEKQAKEDMMHYCATLIQARFRGFNARPRMGYRWAPPRSPGLKFRTWKFAPNEIADELCDLAARIKMPRIPGLTLEPRGKASKRQRNIELAARRQLVLFFKMIRARSIARRYVAQVKSQRNDLMQKRIIRLFRMIFAKSFTSKAMAVKKGKCATKINNFARLYISRKRVRLLKRYASSVKRRNEGAIIITRNLKKMYAKTLLATAGRREALAYEAVDLTLGIIFSGTVDSATGSILRALLGVLSAEKLEEEIINQGADAGLEVMLDALVMGAAQTAGELQLAEQMMELQRLQEEMEAERLRLEAEQSRLAAEEEDERRARQEKEEEVKAAVEREAKAAEAERLREEAAAAEAAAKEEEERQKLEVETSFAEEYLSDLQLSPLGFAASTLAMPCSTTKLRGTRNDYDLGGYFPPAVVKQLEEHSFQRGGQAFTKDGSDYSYDALQSKLEQARQNFDAGAYETAYLLYSVVFRWLLTRTVGDDAAGTTESADSNTTPSLLDALLGLVSPEFATRDEERGFSAGPVLGLIAQVAIFVGDCLHELCMYNAADYKYVLARSLRVQIHSSESNVAVAEVDVKLGHVYTAKSHFSAADSAYRRAVSVLLPMQTSLAAAMLPALTPMSRAAANNPYLEDNNDDDSYAIDGGYSINGLPATKETEFEGGQASAALDIVQYTLVQAHTGHARSLRYAGFYELAYSATQDALNACEVLFTSRGERNELLVADIVLVRASLCKVAGLTRKAYGQYFEAREIYSETLGQEHPTTATSNVRLAYATASLGIFTEAVKLVDTAVTVQRAEADAASSTSLFFGKSSTLAIAQSLYCKGWIYSRIARYDESRSLLETCYQIRCKVFGYDDSHPVVAHAICAMANLAYLRGEFTAALTNFQVASDKLKGSLARALESSEVTPSTTPHFNLVEISYGHAMCLSRYGKAGQALTLFEEVKTSRKAFAGLRHLLLAAGGFDLPRLDESVDGDGDDESKAEVSSLASVADSELNDGRLSKDVQIANIGVAKQLLALGHISEAAALATDAHNHIVALLTEEGDENARDEALGDSLVLLGEVAMAREKWSEADALLDRGCAAKEVVLGEGHPDVAHIILLMAQNLLGPAYTDDAYGCCKRAAELLAVRFDKKSAPMALCLFVTADVLSASKKYDQAQAMYQHALYLAAEFYTDKSVLYGRIQASIGECYRRQKKFDSAAEVLPQALGLLSSLVGKEHIYSLNAIRDLAHVQLELGKDEEALMLLGEHVLPALIESTGVERSPATVYARGLIGLCGHASSDRERKNFKPRDLSDKEREKDTNAQNLIDDALEYFDTYEAGPYADQHPWVLALGGFIGSEPQLASARSARTANTAVASASRLATPAKGFGSATEPELLPMYNPVDAVMDHLLLTEGERQKKLAPLETGSGDTAAAAGRPITALDHPPNPTSLLKDFTEEEFEKRPRTEGRASRWH